LEIIFLEILSILFSKRKYDKEAIKKVTANFKIKETDGGKKEYHLNNLKIGMCQRYNPYEIDPIYTNGFTERNSDTKESLQNIEFKIKITTAIGTSKKMKSDKDKDG
jgi:hypothetical protein